MLVLYTAVVMNQPSFFKNHPSTRTEYTVYFMRRKLSKAQRRNFENICMFLTLLNVNY
jgi:hypothetical protein